MHCRPLRIPLFIAAQKENVPKDLKRRRLLQMPLELRVEASTDLTHVCTIACCTCWKDAKEHQRKQMTLGQVTLPKKHRSQRWE